MQDRNGPSILELYGSEVTGAVLPLLIGGWFVQRGYLISPARHTISELEADYESTYPVLDAVSRQSRKVQMGVVAADEFRKEVAGKWLHEAKHIAADEGFGEQGGRVALPIDGDSVVYIPEGKRTDEQMIMILMAPGERDWSPSDRQEVGAYFEKIIHEQGIKANLSEYWRLHDKVQARLKAAGLG